MAPMREVRIRQAVTADLSAVRAVTDAAYRPYAERIGVVPRPMEADHAANVAAGKVFVTGVAGVRGVTGEPGRGVVGLVVLEAFADHLFLDSVAVHPDAHGRGVGRPRVRWACPR